MGVPDHLTWLLRNLYAGQEAAVRTGHGTTDWFQIRKEYVKAVYCHPAYLTYMQSNPTARYVFCKKPVKKIHAPSVHDRTIYTSQDMEATQMPINR